MLFIRKVLLSFLILSAACGHARSVPAQNELRLIRKSSAIRPSWARLEGKKPTDSFIGASGVMPLTAKGSAGPDRKAIQSASQQAVDGIVGYLGVEIKSKFESQESSDGSQSIKIEMKTESNHILKLDERQSETYWELYEEDGERFQAVFVRIPFNRGDYERAMSDLLSISAAEATANNLQAGEAEKRGDFGAALHAYRQAASLGADLDKFKTLPPALTKDLREASQFARRTLRDRLSSLLVERENEGFAVAPGGGASDPLVITVRYRTVNQQVLNASGLPIEIAASTPDLKLDASDTLNESGKGIIGVVEAPRKEGPVEIKVTIARELFTVAGMQPLTAIFHGDVVSARKAYKVAVLVDDSNVDGGLPKAARDDLEALLATGAQQAGFARIEKGSRHKLKGFESAAELRKLGYSLVVRLSFEPRVDTALTPNLYTFEGSFLLQVVSLSDGREMGRIDGANRDCSNDMSGSGGTRDYALRQAVAISACNGALSKIFNVTLATLQ